jgi:2-polyprenyl-3-methyl-5-hydroxy-6-metoxy-1,4-benzoquinol methylase
MTEIRFEFGENWTRFLETLDESRIQVAVESLQQMIGREDLQGLRFLDIGSGSGLFSLAARRLGAEVVSFDYDPNSVACTRALRETFYEGDPQWAVSQGSVLDGEWVKSLGSFDVVYSWGVLHHTGAMWSAVDVACASVGEGGSLFIAIYNDQGWKSGAWKRIKKTWTRAPRIVRPFIGAPFFAWLWGKASLLDLLRGKPFASWRHYQAGRGMSPWHDFVDWIGGYPFEVASPEQIFDFCRKRGFVLRRLKTVRGSLGCNEFVFEKSA